MLTRCPSCATTFRITPEQLKARQGRVRCGECQAAFNALETLVEDARPATGAATPSVQATEGVAPEPVPAAATATSEPVAAVWPEGAPELAPETAPASGAASTAEEVAAEAPPVVADERPLPFDAAERAPQRAWPWATGAVLAALALALQAIVQFRVDLAVAMPDAKPLLGELCAALGCDLPLPSKAEFVAIESSDLHPDAAGAGRLQLAASLKNRAPHAQQYPHLELTLTDTNDAVLLRRVLAPADYLPKGRSAAAGFAAGADLAVSLALEVKDLAPVGYRLYVFYP